MCDVVSTNPSPWSNTNKYKLNETCFRSFLMGFSDIKIKLHVILDHCPKTYDTMLEKSGIEYTKEYTALGINGTMLKSYDIASQSTGFVLFQECDYLYRPRIGRAYVNALQSLDIVSPYDHRNFYLDKTIHSSTCELRLIEDHHFRSTERNTMTWGTHTDRIREYKDTLDQYGYLDDKVWYDLWLGGVKLWVPIPSFATHCVSDYLAPGIDWESIWKAYR